MDETKTLQLLKGQSQKETLKQQRSLAQKTWSFCFHFLRTTYVCRLRTFHSLPLFKRYPIPFPKVVERNVLEFTGMKEKIFGFAFPTNKAIALVHKPRNCSFFHFLKKTKLSKFKLITEDETRPRFLTVAYLIVKA